MLLEIKKYRKYYLKLIFALLVLIIFMKWVKIDDYSFIWKCFYNAKFWFGCALLVLAQVVKTFRFHILVSEYALKVGFFKLLLIHFIVPILGLVTPSKLGEGTKVLLVKEKKEKVFFCLILEKMMDMGLIVLLALVGIYRYTLFVNSLFLLFPLFIIILFVLINFDRIFNYFLYRRVFRNKLAKNWFLSNLSIFFQLKHLFTFILGVVIWTMNIYAAYLFSLVASQEFTKIPFMDFAPIFASSIIVGLLSGLPGGIGSREAAISYLLFHVFNIDIVDGGVFAILNLFGNYLTFAIIGVTGYLIYKTMYRNSEAF